MSTPPFSQQIETATIPAITSRFGLTRSGIYRALADGRIEAVKYGGRTLIIVPSVVAMISALPKATFRAPGRGKADDAGAIQAA